MATEIACELCLKNLEADFQKGAYYNKILCRSENFYAVSAVGPITVGHLMILPIFHVPSLACLDRNYISELEGLIDSIKEKYVTLGKSVLLFENASSYEDLGSSCMHHAHINLLPYGTSIPDNLSKSLMKQNILGRSMKELPKDIPYIYIEDDSGSTVYSSTGIYPQFIRKQLMLSIGNELWDWTVFRNEPVIRDTIELWER